MDRLEVFMRIYEAETISSKLNEIHAKVFKSRLAKKSL